MGACLGPLTGSTHTQPCTSRFQTKIIQSNGKLSVTLSECFDRKGEIDFREGGDIRLFITIESPKFLNRCLDNFGDFIKF